MIPTLPELVDRLEVNPVIVPLMLAGLLTGMVLVFQSISQWFDERNP
ncbi:MAG TPA: hypothetical protein VJN92_19500 [Candidatus Acidoferrum sp.]|nr:hypothetical protein [Candidatus Acidoferrum sp.]